jgi:nitrogenase subunit NifH
MQRFPMSTTLRTGLSRYRSPQTPRLTGMINNLISPSPCFSSQVTSKGSHCIGVEMLNLIPLTAEVNASKVMSRSTAGVIESGMAVKV